MALDPRTVRAPEFPAVEWLNTDHPPTLDSLRGHTLVVDFWDFTCVNCLRTLPYLRDWHERYVEAGLRIIGVHTPEFRFARSEVHVRSALRRLGIEWPVALDNEQSIWTAYANRAWPTLHLVDRDGKIRARHVGEAGYPQAESDLRVLLATGPGAAAPLPEPAGVLRPADTPGAVCYPSTNELQADSLGNELTAPTSTSSLTLPDERLDGRFYLHGDWRLEDDGWTLESENGSVVLPFHAGAVHAVLSPNPDPVASRSDIIRVEAFLDGQPVPAANLGRDLALRSTAATLLVDLPRTYDVLQDVDPGPHELRLQIARAGLTLFAFSFGACLGAVADPRSAPC